MLNGGVRQADKGDLTHASPRGAFPVLLYQHDPFLGLKSQDKESALLGQWDEAARNSGGRVKDILSEHTREGMLQGYTLTRRVVASRRTNPSWASSIL